MSNNNTQQFKRSERLIDLGRILFQSAQGFTALELGKKMGNSISFLFRMLTGIQRK